MNTKKTLLIDQDGVLTDWLGKFSELLTAMYPDIPHLAREDVKEFMMPLNFEEPYREKINEVIHAPEFYRDMDIVPGAQRAVEMLEEHFNVFLCTSPLIDNLNCATDKMRWISTHLGPQWLKRTVVTYDKTVIDAVALIDDKPEVLGAHQPTWKHVHFRHPYNRHIENAFEIDGWSDEACEFIIKNFA